tara:strand:+ start:144 stop:701 length:558 start_codon:yes stop_codon:yes gene_type:complete
MKIMNDVMLDIETLGNGSNAALVSIGAVGFDLSTGELGAEFNMKIDIETSTKYGDMDASTIKWWFKQSDKAQQVFNARAFGLNTVLRKFTMWLADNFDEKYVKVWGNGSGFDNVILANAYKSTNMIIPWKHWNDRDVRTIVDLGRAIKNIDPKATMQFEGIQHDALDDAKHQAKYVSAIFQALNA